MRSNESGRIRIDLRDRGILIALVLLAVVLALINHDFRKPVNMLNILREASFEGTAAVGMTLCIISGAFDLSIGSLLALLGMVTIGEMHALGLAPTILAILVLGFAAGSLNGILVSYLRIPAFITTLGMMYVYKALAQIYHGGVPQVATNAIFTKIGSGLFLGVPIPFIVFATCAVIGTVILRRTPLGRYIQAIGNSEKASLVAGVKLNRTRIITFGLVGLATAIAAILISSRMWSANSTMKSGNGGYEFNVIAAVVLGGTSLAGGKGSIFNTVVAAVFIAVLKNGMNLLRIEPYWQYVVTGIILLIAFSMNGLRAMLGRILPFRDTQRVI